MKILLKVSSIFISIVILVLALAFIVIEGRLLLAGDWLIYDSPIMGFIRYLFRLLISVFAFSKSLGQIIFINDKNKKDRLLFLDYILMICAIIILIFATNYVGVVCFGLSTINLLISVGIKKIN